MSQFNYPATAATATRLLQRFGAACTIKHPTGTAYDPDTGTMTPTVTSTPSTAAVFDFAQKYVDGTLILQGDKQAYCAPGVAVAQGDVVPPLDSLALGTDIYPDQSATCVVDVLRATATTTDSPVAWHLRGPGIQNVAALHVDGLPDDFEVQWAANQAVFPRGVDLLLATLDHIVGLPRTTQATRSAAALQEA